MNRLIVSYIMISFGNPNVKNRMLCSCISARSISCQLILGHIVIGLGIWIICLLMPIALYGKECQNDPHLPYYLLNTFLMTLTIPLMISSFIGKELMRKAMDSDTSVIRNVFSR